jgi:hypothetical protein
MTIRCALAVAVFLAACGPTSSTASSPLDGEATPDAGPTSTPSDSGAPAADGGAAAGAPGAGGREGHPIPAGGESGWIPPGSWDAGVGARAGAGTGAGGALPAAGGAPSGAGGAHLEGGVQGADPGACDLGGAVALSRACGGSVLCPNGRQSCDGGRWGACVDVVLQRVCDAVGVDGCDPGLVRCASGICASSC